MAQLFVAAPVRSPPLEADAFALPDNDQLTATASNGALLASIVTPMVCEDVEAATIEPVALVYAWPLESGVIHRHSLRAIPPPDTTTLTEEVRASGAPTAHAVAVCSQGDEIGVVALWSCDPQRTAVSAWVVDARSAKAAPWAATAFITGTFRSVVELERLDGPDPQGRGGSFRFVASSRHSREMLLIQFTTATPDGGKPGVSCERISVDAAPRDGCGRIVQATESVARHEVFLVLSPVTTERYVRTAPAEEPPAPFAVVVHCDIVPGSSPGLITLQLRRIDSREVPPPIDPSTLDDATFSFAPDESESCDDTASPKPCMELPVQAWWAETFVLDESRADHSFRTTPEASPTSALAHLRASFPSFVRGPAAPLVAARRLPTGHDQLSWIIVGTRHTIAAIRNQITATMVYHEASALHDLRAWWGAKHEIALVASLWDWNCIRIHRCDVADRDEPTATLVSIRWASEYSPLCHFASLSRIAPPQTNTANVAGFALSQLGDPPVTTVSLWVAKDETLAMDVTAAVAPPADVGPPPPRCLWSNVAQTDGKAAALYAIRSVGRTAEIVQFDGAQLRVAAELTLPAAITAVRMAVVGGTTLILIGCSDGLVAFEALPVSLLSETVTPLPLAYRSCYWHSGAVVALNEIAIDGCWGVVWGARFVSADMSGELAFHPDYSRSGHASERGGPAPVVVPPPTVTANEIGQWSVAIDPVRGWVYHATPMNAVVWHVGTCNVIHRVRGRSGYNALLRGRVHLHEGRSGPTLDVRAKPLLDRYGYVTQGWRQDVTVDVTSLSKILNEAPGLHLPVVAAALYITLPDCGPWTGELRKLLGLGSIGAVLDVSASDSCAATPNALARHLVGVETVFGALRELLAKRHTAAELRGLTIELLDAAHGEWAETLCAQRPLRTATFAAINAVLGYAMHEQAVVRAAAREALVTCVRLAPLDVLRGTEQYHALRALRNRNSESERSSTSSTRPGSKPRARGTPRITADSIEQMRSLCCLGVLIIAMHTLTLSHAKGLVPEGTIQPMEFAVSAEVLEGTVSALVTAARTFRCALRDVSSQVLLDLLTDGWPIFRTLVVDEDREALWAHLLADAASEGDAALMNYAHPSEPCQKPVTALGTFIAAQVPAFIQFALDVASEQRSIKPSLKPGRSVKARLGTVEGEVMPVTDSNHLRVAALRVLHAMCLRYPDRFQRAVHAILRFAWACIDPHTPAPAMRRLCTPAVAALFRAAVERVGTFAFNAPAQRVAVSSGDEATVSVYDVRTTSKIAVFSPAGRNLREGQQAPVVAAIAFGADGSTLLTLARGGTEIGVWQLEMGKSLFGLLSGGSSAQFVKTVPCPALSELNPRAKLRLHLLTPVLAEVIRIRGPNDPEPEGESIRVML
jgi:hypothetical protein